jgi:hypothetical protein
MNNTPIISGSSCNSYSWTVEQEPGKALEGQFHESVSGSSIRPGLQVPKCEIFDRSGGLVNLGLRDPDP